MKNKINNNYVYPSQQSGLLFSCDHDKPQLHRSSIAPSQDKINDSGLCSLSSHNYLA